MKCQTLKYFVTAFIFSACGPISVMASGYNFPLPSGGTITITAPYTFNASATFNRNMLLGDGITDTLNSYAYGVWGGSQTYLNSLFIGSSSTHTLTLYSWINSYSSATIHQGIFVSSASTFSDTLTEQKGINTATITVSGEATFNGTVGMNTTVNIGNDSTDGLNIYSYATSNTSHSFVMETTTPSTSATKATLWALNECDSAELRVIDGGGNNTRLSPHVDIDRWIYESSNLQTGRRVFVDMDILSMEIQKLSNVKFRTVSYFGIEVTPEQEKIICLNQEKIMKLKTQKSRVAAIKKLIGAK